jgi:hypothetical protein
MRLGFLNPSGVCILRHVVQRLQAAEVDGRFHLAREAPHRVGLHGRPDRGLTGLPFEGGGKPVVSEQRGVDSSGEVPEVLEGLGRRPLDGVGVDELRRRHGTALGADDPMKFAAVLDRIVVHDLAWVLSAIVQLLEHERGEPLAGHMNAVAAMAKYGVATEPACYASSVGVRNRDDALALGDLFPTMFGVNLPLFLAWVSTLAPGDVTGHVSPDTARLFLDRAAALLTPQDALDLLVTESGNLFVPLRGIGPMRTAAVVQQLSIGDDVTLVREYDNRADENAIAVITAGRTKVGYVAREVARVLAPLLDLEEGPRVAAVLATRPTTAAGTAEDDVHAALEARDAVRIEVVVSPRDAAAAAG